MKHSITSTTSNTTGRESISNYKVMESELARLRADNERLREALRRIENKSNG